VPLQAGLGTVSARVGASADASWQPEPWRLGADGSACCTRVYGKRGLVRAKGVDGAAYEMPDYTAKVLVMCINTAVPTHSQYQPDVATFDAAIANYFSHLLVVASASRFMFPLDSVLLRSLSLLSSLLLKLVDKMTTTVRTGARSVAVVDPVAART